LQCDMATESGEVKVDKVPALAESAVSPKVQEARKGDDSQKEVKAEEEAAVKIQANFRGFRARTRVKEKKKRDTAAVKIQKTFRGLKQRKSYVQQSSQRNEAATKIQASFRGSFLRKRQSVTADVRGLYEKIQMATKENSEVEQKHQEMEQRVQKVLEEMGENQVVAADADSLWNTSLEGPQALYEKQLQNFIQTKYEYKISTEQSSSRIQRLTAEFEKQHDHLIDLRDTFRQFRRALIKTAINPRTGKPVTSKWILQMEQDEDDIEDALGRARLNNIKLNMKHKQVEQKIKEKETLGDGLHLIDFEQLKIENQTLGEKIEIRNIELGKLKSKISTTVHILAHVKMKLQFEQSRNKLSKETLEKLEAEVGEKRDRLTRLKQKRDELRARIQSLKVKEGFAGSDLLVKDYESRKDAKQMLVRRLQELRDHHEELTQMTMQNTHDAKSMFDSFAPGESSQEGPFDGAFA